MSDMPHANANAALAPSLYAYVYAHPTHVQVAQDDKYILIICVDMPVIHDTCRYIDIDTATTPLNCGIAALAFYLLL